MIARAISTVTAGIRGTIALAGATLLILGLFSVGLPPASRFPSAALADPGGNGNGNGKGKGGENGNGGQSGAHGNNGGGAGAGSASGDEGESEDATGAPQAGAAGSAERGGSEFVPDEVVVANLGDDARSAVGNLGFVVLDEQQLASLGLTITRLRVPRHLTAPAARTLLASRYPGILVDVNAIYRPQGQLSLPPPDYPARQIGWGSVPATCGHGIRMGMLDTSVDAATPGLSGAAIVQRSFLPAGAKAATAEHGTAIAAILVGQRSGGGSGLLPGAELTVAGAFGADPDGIPIGDVMALVGGLDWLVSSRVPVINMSFAGDANVVVALALRRVVADHVIVVAAAGNGGPAAPPAFPADEPGVIGVTAVDNRSRPYAEANRGDYIDFAAPGVRIWTPGPTAAGSYHTGTSFAAPFVTAAVAAWLAGGATMDGDRVVDALGKTAIDLGQPGKDSVFGRGLIQVANPCGQQTQ
jgi:hypothetical protein